MVYETDEQGVQLSSNKLDLEVFEPAKYVQRKVMEEMENDIEDKLSGLTL